MIMTDVKYGKPDISMSCNGMLAGLVAITAPCAFVAPWAAVIIGGDRGLARRVERRVLRPARRRRPVRRDLGARRVRRVGRARASGCSPTGRYGIGWNGVGASSTHGVRGLFYGDPGQLGAQMFHVVVGFVWAWGLGWLLFTIAKRFMQIRVSAEAEIEGLDVPEFGALAYPDFVMHHAPPGHIDRGCGRRPGRRRRPAERWTSHEARRSQS